MRMRVEGAQSVDRLLAQGQRMIIAFWHAQQLMMPLAYRGTEAHVLISRHGDGELIQRIIAQFGLQAVRGSSTRGGVEALRELIRLGRSGVDLVITPDGPKGPRQVAKMGVVQLAKVTGLPIVPLAFGCSKKTLRELGSLHHALSVLARHLSLGRADSCVTRGDGLCVGAQARRA